MTPDEIKVFLRTLAETKMAQMEKWALKELMANWEIDRRAAHAAKTYCDGGVEVIATIMAYIGDNDGLRMLQEQRERM